MIDEVGAVGRAEGIALAPEVEGRWMSVLETTARNAPQLFGSMYYDVIAGRRTELEYLNGTVVRLGRAHGVPTPMNFAIYTALLPYADGAGPAVRRAVLAANIGNFVAACLFGGAVVATRVAVRAVPPLSLTFARYAIGGLLLLLGILIGARASLRYRWRDLPLLILLGSLLFALFPWTFNAGLQRTEASRGALMLATSPIWMAILARASRGERLTNRQWAGLTLTFTGVVVVLSERGMHWAGNTHALAGDGLLLIAAVCGALYAVLARRAFVRYRPLVVTSYTMVIGAILLMPAALGEGLVPAVAHLSGQTSLLLLYLGVPAGALAWAAFVFSLTRLTPTQAAVYINLNPLVATMLGAVLLGERLTMLFLIGFVVVLAGVVLVNWPARAKELVVGEAALRPGT